jgi:hypothetical protein
MHVLYIVVYAYSFSQSLEYAHAYSILFYRKASMRVFAVVPVVGRSTTKNVVDFVDFTGKLVVLVCCNNMEKNNYLL